MGTKAITHAMICEPQQQQLDRLSTMICQLSQSAKASTSCAANKPALVRLKCARRAMSGRQLRRHSIKQTRQALAAADCMPSALSACPANIPTVAKQSQLFVARKPRSGVRTDPPTHNNAQRDELVGSRVSESSVAAGDELIEIRPTQPDQVCIESVAAAAIQASRTQRLVHDNNRLKQVDEESEPTAAPSGDGLDIEKMEAAVHRDMVTCSSETNAPLCLSYVLRRKAKVKAAKEQRAAEKERQECLQITAGWEVAVKPQQIVVEKCEDATTVQCRSKGPRGPAVLI